MASIAIRRIRESDVDGFRELRLRSLATDPLAFGSTLAREQAYAPEQWSARTQSSATSSDESVWLAVLDPGTLIGMIGTFRKDRQFQVYGMWVDPDHRDSGLGGRLLDTLLEWVIDQDPSTPVLLSVNPSQVAAVRLYLRRGFRPTGVVDPIDHTPGAVAHEMRRPAGRNVESDAA